MKWRPLTNDYAKNLPGGSLVLLGETHEAGVVDLVDTIHDLVDATEHHVLLENIDLVVRGNRSHAVGDRSAGHGGVDAVLVENDG